MANIGDRIIMRKANGKCDIFKIDETGERELVRDDIAPLHQAWEIARGADAMVWVCDEGKPDKLEPYIVNRLSGL